MNTNYSKYIASDSWKETRREFKKKEIIMCWVCGSEKNIQIHHLNYKRVGRENPEDLVPLCGHHHKRLHFSGGKHNPNKPIESLKELIDKEGKRTIEQKKQSLEDKRKRSFLQEFSEQERHVKNIVEYI